jgi:transcriptional regulator with XRE-family HTH domain
MGTTQSAIARLEAGNSLPSMKSLYRYAEATGTTPAIQLLNA